MLVHPEPRFGAASAILALLILLWPGTAAALDGPRLDRPSVLIQRAGGAPPSHGLSDDAGLPSVPAAQPLKRDGAQCFSALECASRKCVSNICGGPRRPNGAQCFSAVECASQVCIGNICGGPRKPNGAQCFSALECASQICSRNICGGRR